MTYQIQKSIDLFADAPTVWALLVDPDQFYMWCLVMKGVPFEADLAQMEQEKLFSFTCLPCIAVTDGRGKPLRTLVEFRLKKIEKGIRLTLTETGFDAFPVDKRDQAMRMHEDVWSQRLKALESYLYTRK